MPSSFIALTVYPPRTFSSAGLNAACRRHAIIEGMQDGSLIPRFGRARRDRSLAVLEE